MRRAILIAVTACAAAFCANAQEAAQAQPCAESTLPQGVRAELAGQFAEWRLQTAADLVADYRKAWAEKHAGDCPGIAPGNFESKSEQSYALLLIPREKGKRGYRLAVFRAGKAESYSFTLLEQSDETLPSDSAIFRIQPGLQFNEEKFAAFKLKTDAIYVETFEKGGYIYYWKRGKFERVLESD